MKRELIDPARLRAEWEAQDLTDDDTNRAAKGLRARWRSWRLWRKQRHDAYMDATRGELAPSFLYPLPLILEGVVLVSHTTGGSNTAAVVHATAWVDSSGSAQLTEQWLVFGSSVETSLTFSDGRDDFDLALSTEPYPERLPSAVLDRPFSSNSTHWRGVANGDAVNASQFFSGVVRWVANNPESAGTARYACGTVTRREGLDATHTERTKFLNVGRKWVESSYMSSSAEVDKRSWVYAEWPKPMGQYQEGGQVAKKPYTPVTIHMAWPTTFALPPAQEVSSSCLVSQSLNYKDWVKMLEDTSQSWFSAKSEVRIFNATDLSGLTVPPLG